MHYKTLSLCALSGGLLLFFVAQSVWKYTNCAATPNTSRNNLEFRSDALSGKPHDIPTISRLTEAEGRLSTSGTSRHTGIYLPLPPKDEDIFNDYWTTNTTTHSGAVRSNVVPHGPPVKSAPSSTVNFNELNLKPPNALLQYTISMRNKATSLAFTGSPSSLTTLLTPVTSSNPQFNSTEAPLSPPPVYTPKLMELGPSVSIFPGSLTRLEETYTERHVSQTTTNDLSFNSQDQDYTIKFPGGFTTPPPQTIIYPEVNETSATQHSFNYEKPSTQPNSPVKRTEVSANPNQLIVQPNIVSIFDEAPASALPAQPVLDTSSITWKINNIVFPEAEMIRAPFPLQDATILLTPETQKNEGVPSSSQIQESKITEYVTPLASQAGGASATNTLGPPPGTASETNTLRPPPVSAFEVNTVGISPVTTSETNTLAPKPVTIFETNTLPLQSVTVFGTNTLTNTADLTDFSLIPPRCGPKEKKQESTFPKKSTTTSLVFQDQLNATEGETQTSTAQYNSTPQIRTAPIRQDESLHPMPSAIKITYYLPPLTSSNRKPSAPQLKVIEQFVDFNSISDTLEARRAFRYDVQGSHMMDRAFFDGVNDVPLLGQNALPSSTASARNPFDPIGFNNDFNIDDFDIIDQLDAIVDMDIKDLVNTTEDALDVELSQPENLDSALPLTSTKQTAGFLQKHPSGKKRSQKKESVSYIEWFPSSGSYLTAKIIYDAPRVAETATNSFLKRQNNTDSLFLRFENKTLGLPTQNSRETLHSVSYAGQTSHLDISRRLRRQSHTIRRQQLRN